MSMSLYEWLVKSAMKADVKLTKKEFGRVMHDPDATEDEIRNALDMLSEADGYDNLPDD